MNLMFKTGLSLALPAAMLGLLNAISFQCTFVAVAAVGFALSGLLCLLADALIETLKS